MTHSSARERRVLVLYPTTRCFGYVVLEPPAALIDWGVTRMRADRVRTIVARISRLMDQYAPEVLVTGSVNLDPRKRVGPLLEEIGDLASARGMRIRQISKSRALSALPRLRARTNHGTALLVARCLPDLAPYLPRRRKLWRKEDYSMAIFQAAILALAYFNMRRDRATSVLSAQEERNAVT